LFVPGDFYINGELDIVVNFVDSNFRFRARLHYGRSRVSRFTWAV
jgi:hypothetical protein